jgi:hypothetical protein
LDPRLKEAADELSTLANALQGCIGFADRLRVVSGKSHDDATKMCGELRRGTDALARAVQALTKFRTEGK